MSHRGQFVRRQKANEFIFPSAPIEKSASKFLSISLNHALPRCSKSMKSNQGVNSTLLPFFVLPFKRLSTISFDLSGAPLADTDEVDIETPFYADSEARANDRF